MRSLLSLVMIVRDEAARICETIGSARDAVDRFTIFDTGSTDGTPDLVRQLAVDLGLPGTVHCEPAAGGPFDYAAARNHALALEAADPDAASYALVLSGDEVLSGGVQLRAFLEEKRGDGCTDAEDAYLVRMFLDESEWDAARVVPVGCGWVYESIGGVHEYLAHYEVDGVVEVPRERAPDAVSIRHEASDPERRFWSIVEHQIPALSAALVEDPDDSRALLFLAQATEACFPALEGGELLSRRMEVMSFYLRRMQLRGDEEEVRYARARYLEVARQTGIYTPEEVLARFQEACELDPDRAENHLFRAFSAHEANRSRGEVRALALEAARVAEGAQGRRSRFPRNTSCLWRALVLAARSSRRAAALADGEDREAGLAEVAQLADRAYRAGCPAEVRDALLSPLPERNSLPERAA